MLFDQFPESKALVQLPHQNQAIVGTDSRALKSDPQKPVERQLKQMFFALTYSGYTSGRQCCCSNPHQY